MHILQVTISVAWRSQSLFCFITYLAYYQDSFNTINRKFNSSELPFDSLPFGFDCHIISIFGMTLMNKTLIDTSNYFHAT